MYISLIGKRKIFMNFSSSLNSFGVKPGFTLIHKHIKNLIKNPIQKNLILSKSEIKVMKENLDDYLMYIWTHLGDTRYNRSGYRSAFETLTYQINKNS